MFFLGPRHTFASVVRELRDGLEDGSINVDFKDRPEPRSELRPSVLCPTLGFLFLLVAMATAVGLETTDWGQHLASQLISRLGLTRLPTTTSPSLGKSNVIAVISRVVGHPVSILIVGFFILGLIDIIISATEFKVELLSNRSLEPAVLYELLCAKLEHGRVFFQYIASSIPFLGFLGTLVGIARALSYAQNTAQDDTVWHRIAGHLGAAFDSTLLALGCSLVLLVIDAAVSSVQKSNVLRYASEAVQELSVLKRTMRLGPTSTHDESHLDVQDP